MADSALPTILVYQPGFAYVPEYWDCEVNCLLTRDASLLDQADTVVFHIPNTGVPTIPKRPGQAWVAWSMESDINYPILCDPYLMRRFDLTMTYRRDSDIWTPYVNPGMYGELLTPPLPKTGDALAVCFISSGVDWSGRQAYLRELMADVPVASYGRFMTNRSLAEDEGRSTKIATLARYKFTLAFENSITRDYVTEKFFDALVAGSVPVYLGAPNVAEFAPDDHCFINVADFSGPRELAEHLQRLSDDQASYQELLAWKERGLSRRFTQTVDAVRLPNFCRLCLRLRERRQAHAD
jgi:hypothetical protein